MVSVLWGYFACLRLRTRYPTLPYRGTVPYRTVPEPAAGTPPPAAAALAPEKTIQNKPTKQKQRQTCQATDGRTSMREKERDTERRRVLQCTHTSEGHHRLNSGGRFCSTILCGTWYSISTIGTTGTIFRTPPIRIRCSSRYSKIIVIHQHGSSMAATQSCVPPPPPHEATNATRASTIA